MPAAKMTPDNFWPDETSFQRWVVKELSSRGHHVQPLTGDPKYPGIPDLAIALPEQEVWAEVKLYRGEYYCHTTLGEAQTKERELTAQQYEWLRNRSWASCGGTLCGVLLAFRTTPETPYVAFIPIHEWEMVLNQSLAALILSDRTDTCAALLSGRRTLHEIIRGRK